MPQRHDVKIWVDWFDPVDRNEKTFDLRKDDRAYAVGDTVKFFEIRHKVGEFTGRVTEKRICYIERGEKVEAFGLRAGFCVLGLGSV